MRAALNVVPTAILDVKEPVARYGRSATIVDDLFDDGQLYHFIGVPAAEMDVVVAFGWSATRGFCCADTRPFVLVGEMSLLLDVVGGAIFSEPYDVAVLGVDINLHRCQMLRMAPVNCEEITRRCAGIVKRILSERAVPYMKVGVCCLVLLDVHRHNGHVRDVDGYFIAGTKGDGALRDGVVVGIEPTIGKVSAVILGSTGFCDSVGTDRYVREYCLTGRRVRCRGDR